MLETAGRKVWAFVGDGEMDEPESLAGALARRARGPRQPHLRRQLQPAAARRTGARQRLDHPGARRPVRGRGLERDQGAVGRRTGTRSSRATRRAVMLQRLHETVDGEFQKYAATDGRFNREHFFNKYPELQAHGRAPVGRRHRPPAPRRPRPGQDLRRVSRRGPPHRASPRSFSPRPRRATAWVTGARASMGTHQQKKLEDDALLAFRDRFALPLSDDDVREPALLQARATTRPEMKYLHARRETLGGYLPARSSQRADAAGARARPRSRARSRARGDREQSTTMVFVQHARRSSCATRASASTSCRSSPTRHAPSACSRSSARSGSTRRSASSTSPRTRTSCSTTRRRSDGQILEEGITEAGALVLVDRGGDVLQRARRADAAVLHLLLDVRLPARGRPHLGGGRLARARLSARRDRRAHDALGRRAAAPGRYEPSRRPRRSRTAAPTTRASATSSR